MSDPVKPVEHFKFKPSDLVSDTWARLKQHLLERQTSLRQQLEGDLNEGDTAKLRGRLAEVKRLLDLGKDN